MGPSVFEWVWPWIFALLPLPWLLRVVLPPKPHDIHAIRVPFFGVVESLSEETRGHAPWPRILGLLAMLVWIAVLAAGARPMWVGEPVLLPLTGRDLMLAIDISGSMREEDMLVGDDYLPRIDSVKAVVAEFLEARRGDRVGLILFGERSYLQTPLTFDRNTVGIQLREALPGFAGNATAIGDAIGLSVRTLRKRPAESRVLILLTDGANTAGSDPRQAALGAQEAGIRIHTIGVGADRKLERGFFGNAREVNPSRDLDEDLLRHIAESTGGRFFRARDPQAMAAIYEEINQLEPVPEEKTYRPRKSLFHWPLGVGLGIAVLTLGLHRRTQAGTTR
jgi:Ca-activated chloride channel family protein